MLILAHLTPGEAVALAAVVVLAFAAGVAFAVRRFGRRNRN
jgi:hypothetical protein